MKEHRNFFCYNRAKLGDLRLIEKLMEGPPMLSPFITVLLQNKSPVGFKSAEILATVEPDVRTHERLHVENGRLGAIGVVCCPCG
jgi:hypothetical protein